MNDDSSDARRQLSLLIVDDHRIFAEVLSMRLLREPGVTKVATAYSLDEARVLTRKTDPDVVILDCDVAGEVGSDLIPDLLGLPRPPQVVMLSASEQASEVIDCLSAGASAWVVKGARVETLMLAADEVLHGRMFLHPVVVRPVIESLLQQIRGHHEPTFLDDLSDRQMQVLRCLVAGLTRPEIADRLFITANTVRTHVQHVLALSGEHSTLALVARAQELAVAGIDEPMAKLPSSSR